LANYSLTYGILIDRKIKRTTSVVDLGRKMNRGEGERGGRTFL
jgi:hypothetical protein